MFDGRNEIPPFRLLNTAHEFHAMLTEIHRLCRKHYAALDLDRLASYAAPPPAASAPVSASGTATTGPAERMAELAQPLPANDYIDCVSPETYRRHLSPPGVPRPADPFSDHSVLYHALARALSRPQNWQTADKVEDQFKNLPGFRDKNDSHMFSSTRRSGTSATSWAKSSRQLHSVGDVNM